MQHLSEKQQIERSTASNFQKTDSALTSIPISYIIHRFPALSLPPDPQHAPNCGMVSHEHFRDAFHRDRSSFENAHDSVVGNKEPFCDYPSQ